jgi:hypothetical protein
MSGYWRLRQLQDTPAPAPALRAGMTRSDASNREPAARLCTIEFAPAKKDRPQSADIQADCRQRMP